MNDIRGVHFPLVPFCVATFLRRRNGGLALLPNQKGPVIFLPMRTPKERARASPKTTRPAGTRLSAKSRRSATYDLPLHSSAVQRYRSPDAPGGFGCTALLAQEPFIAEHVEPARDPFNEQCVSCPVMIRTARSGGIWRGTPGRPYRHAGRARQEDGRSSGRHRSAQVDGRDRFAAALRLEEGGHRSPPIVA